MLGSIYYVLIVRFCILLVFTKILFAREFMTCVYPDHSFFFFSFLTRAFCVVIFLISVYTSHERPPVTIVTRWVGEYIDVYVCTCRRCDLYTAYLSRQKYMNFIIGHYYKIGQSYLL